MVIVSPTTISPAVKYISGCGLLSQVSQLSQPEITLPVTALWNAEMYIPSVTSVTITIHHVLPQQPKKFIASCKVSANFRPVRQHQSMRHALDHRVRFIN